MRSIRSLRLSTPAVITAISGTQQSQQAFSSMATSVMASGRSSGAKFNASRFALAAGGAAAFLATQTSADCEAEMKGASGNDPYASTALFPPIKAYKKGMLRVSNVHSIAYSLYGNPKGKPVLFVHGGPGGGTDPGK